MDKNIGERIKTLRQKEGLTQAGLADKLGFQPQTVSNWENGTREPDISALASLSSLFNVSLDYLLLGKEDEAISLDDMDTAKRLSLLIKKDDVKSFKKYEYVTSSFIFARRNSRRTYYGYQDYDELNKDVWLDIIDKKAKKIFNVCCDELIKRNTKKVWAAFQVYDFIDEFVKMVVDIDKPEALETIGFRVFGVGEMQKETPFQYNQDIWHYINNVDTYFIKPETFEYIFQNRKQSPKCFEYATTLELQIVPLNRYDNRLEYTYTHLHNKIVEMSIKYKTYDVLDRLLTTYREELNKDLPENSFNSYQMSYSSGWVNTYVVSGNRVCGRVFYFRKDDIESLIKEGELEYAKKLNDYDAEVFSRMGKLKYGGNSKEFDKVGYLTEPEFGREVKLNGKLDEKERIMLECINNYILVPNKIRGLRDLKLVRKILDNGYWNYYEFAYDCLKNKKQSLLLKFFLDNGLESLAELLIKGKEYPSRLLESVWIEFNENNERSVPKCLSSINNKVELKNGFIIYNGKSIDASHESRKLEDNCLITIFNEKKEQLYKGVENAIAAEKKAKEDEEERAKIVKGLTREYFEGLLSKGEDELFIIKLCSLLDAVYRFDYHFDGEDFSARMNQYFEMLEKALPQSRDMDDGWGYMILDQKYEDEEVIPAREEFNHKKNLFNRLRMQRNNIAHSEHKKVEQLSQRELEECLDYIVAKKENK